MKVKPFFFVSLTETIRVSLSILVDMKITAMV